MKKYTHAWIAFKAIERLESAQHSAGNLKPAQDIVRWFKARKDGVIKGAWYPDSIIKDNSTSHVLKFTPDDEAPAVFPALPTQTQLYKLRGKSPCYRRGYRVEPGDNLPERCEALAHSVIDNLKVRDAEDKGSPVAPTDNHVSLILFMLSHYVADAHVPPHCDGRKFSDGADIHGEMEGVWEKEIEKHLDIDTPDERFFYSPGGYPLVRDASAFDRSILRRVETELAGRAFKDSYGGDSSNVLEYMHALCRHSYLLSYSFIPPGFDEKNVRKDNWRNLPGQAVTLDELNVAVLSDAIDSVARIWLRVWRRFGKWEDAKQPA